MRQFVLKLVETWHTIDLFTWCYHRTSCQCRHIAPGFQIAFHVPSWDFPRIANRFSVELGNMWVLSGKKCGKTFCHKKIMGNLPCIISMRPKCSHVLVVYLRISWNIPFREKYSYDFTRCIYKNAHSKDQTRDNRGVTKRACSTWFVATVPMSSFVKRSWPVVSIIFSLLWEIT